jgi:hypothetical protein
VQAPVRSHRKSDSRCNAGNHGQDTAPEPPRLDQTIRLCAHVLTFPLI